MIGFQRPSALVKAYFNLPRIEIALGGQGECREIYEKWSARHPRFPLVGRKEIGVALVELPVDFDDYLRGKEKEYMRRRRNRALRLGYSFRSFLIDEEIENVMQVNLSMETRQGRSIEAGYLKRDEVLGFHRRGGWNYGVFDSDGKLVAYTYVPICGEMAMLSRLFGHGDHLENGVMYLMISEVIRELLNARISRQRLRWLNYDMWYGAASGLRFFKQHLGFQPYRVTWIWDDKLSQCC